MTTPEIRYFHSPDVDDLEDHQPPEPDNFSLLIQMMVGPKGGKGEEAFEVLVSTPAWLTSRYAPDEVVPGTDRLIVFSYDWPRIEAFLRKRVSACTGDDWQQVAQKIGRFARWEFEDGEP